MNIYDADFEFNLASSGGLFYVDNSAKINITSSVILNNQAELRGGLFMIEQT